MTGIDLNYSQSIIKNLRFDIGASYVYAQDILNSEPLILIPPLNSFQKLKFSPKKSKWTFEISNHISAKQNRFPDSNFIFDYIEDGTIVSKTVDISESPSGFHRFDAIFSLQIRNQKNLTTNLRLIAQNILNTDYRDYLNRMRYYSSELGRNLQIQLNFNY